MPGEFDATANSDEFYKEVARNNQDVINQFKELMGSGIRLVYVSGNHDMTLSHKTLEDILPGIVQSRDVRGLGRYDKPKVVVNEGTWIDRNTDDPQNTATFALIDSGSETTKVELLKCVGDDFVQVKNEYVDC